MVGSRCPRSPAASVAAALLGAACQAWSADPAAGRKHYVSICAACHGLKGAPQIAYVPSFARGEGLHRDHVDHHDHEAELVRSVREGIYRMPPWGGYLTDREIADAIAYARTLVRKPGTAKRAGAAAVPASVRGPKGG